MIARPTAIRRGLTVRALVVRRTSAGRRTPAVRRGPTDRRAPGGVRAACGRLTPRLTAVTVALALGLGLAACGSSGAGSGGGGTTTQGVSARSGRGVFAEAGCGGCHTLAAAGASGNIGPDLDQLRPSAALVRHQVTHGGGGMPAFGGQLSAAQIRAVAAFVAGATHGH